LSRTVKDQRRRLPKAPPKATANGFIVPKIEGECGE